VSQLEGLIANNKVRVSADAKIDLADGEVGSGFFHRCNVACHMVRKVLIVISQEADIVPEGEQGSDVPGDGSDAGFS